MRRRLITIPHKLTHTQVLLLQYNIHTESTGSSDKINREGGAWEEQIKLKQDT